MGTGQSRLGTRLCGGRVDRGERSQPSSVVSDQQTSGCVRVGRVGTKTTSRTKTGCCRKFRILTSPPEENQKEEKDRRSDAERWTFRQRTAPASSPNQPPQREKAGGKDALTISCMVELFVGSNRKTRLRPVEKAEREEGPSGGRRANLRRGFHQTGLQHQKVHGRPPALVLLLQVPEGRKRFPQFNSVEESSINLGGGAAGCPPLL